MKMRAVGVNAGLLVVSLLIMSLTAHGQEDAKSTNEAEKPSLMQRLELFWKERSDKEPLRARRNIRLPTDAQPAVPPLPAIGEYVDMPGTSGRVEFTRLTGPTSEGGSLTHSYSRRSAIDPFNKYILFNGYLYDLSTISEFKEVPFNSEYVSANTLEDVFFGVKGNALLRWNASTDQVTEIWSDPEVTELTIGKWEGQQSWDDAIIAVTWQNQKEFIATIDLNTGTVIGQIEASNVDGKFNWVDVSPRGTYVVVGTDRGVFRYDANFSNKIQLNANQHGNAHSDLMLDKVGNEVFVQEGHFHGGDIAYTVLATNELHQMDLVNTDKQNPVTFPSAAAHISGQATNLHGRVLVSLNYQTGMSSIFSADLKPGQSKIYSWGHSYSTGTSYFSEAHASISSDGRSIVWTSDWMESGSNYEFLARIKKN